MSEPKENVLMEKIVSLCKRRGFVFQSSEIYGGINGFWDYGQLGAELKRNVKDAWWKTIVHHRDDVAGLEATIIMHPKIWEASGHVATFTDPMCDCLLTKKRFRADQVEAQSGIVHTFAGAFGGLGTTHENIDYHNGVLHQGLERYLANSPVGAFSNFSHPVLEAILRDFLSVSRPGHSKETIDAEALELSRMKTELLVGDSYSVLLPAGKPRKAPAKWRFSIIHNVASRTQFSSASTRRRWRTRPVSTLRTVRCSPRLSPST